MRIARGVYKLTVDKATRAVTRVVAGRELTPRPWVVSVAVVTGITEGVHLFLDSQQAQAVQRIAKDELPELERLARYDYRYAFFSYQLPLDEKAAEAVFVRRALVNDLLQQLTKKPPGDTLFLLEPVNLGILIDLQLLPEGAEALSRRSTEQKQNIANALAAYLIETEALAHATWSNELSGRPSDGLILKRIQAESGQYFQFLSKLESRLDAEARIRFLQGDAFIRARGRISEAFGTHLPGMEDRLREAMNDDVIRYLK